VAVRTAAAVGLGLALFPSAATAQTWSGGAGSWGDAAKWGGTIPDGAAVDVFIDGGKTGTASAVTLDQFRTVRDLTIDAGDSLEIDPALAFGFMANGTVTVNGRLGSPTGRVGIPFGPGDRTITGAGIVYTQGMGNGDTLTIGSGLTIDAAGNWLGRYANHGTIVAGTTFGLSIGVTNALSHNHGSIESTTGGFFGLYNVDNKAGAVVKIHNTPNATLEGASAWTNNGTVSYKDTTLDVRGGSFTTAQMANFKSDGGTNVVRFASTIENTGNTLDFKDAATTVYLKGTGNLNPNEFNTLLNGGTLKASNGAVVYLSGALLKNVTLSGNVQFDPQYPVLRVEGDLTLDNMHLEVPEERPLGGPTIGFVGSGPHSLKGTGTIVLKGPIPDVSGTAASPLTIESGITIKGNGYVAHAINYGTLMSGTGEFDDIKLINVTNYGTIVVNPGEQAQARAGKEDNTGTALITQTAVGLTKINGTLASDVDVDITGGTLGGSGALSMAGQTVTLDTTVAPGNSIGTLSVTASTLILPDGARLSAELDGAGSADLLSVTGNLDLSAPNNALDLTALGTLTGDEYVVATWTGTRTGTFETVTPGFDVAYDDANRQIVVTPVPEPGTGLALLAATGVLLRRRRR